MATGNPKVANVELLNKAGLLSLASVHAVGAPGTTIGTLTRVVSCCYHTQAKPFSGLPEAAPFAMLLDFALPALSLELLNHRYCTTNSYRDNCPQALNHPYNLAQTNSVTLQAQNL
jgi:hypothetical protein